jgi:thiol-disulfide isomerase/thioredoxin
MKYIVILFVLSLLIAGPASSQQSNIRELKAGDTVPEIVVAQLIKSSNRSIRISDLYQKGLLIIDFWATWCVPCIKEIKLADSLAGVYRNLTFLSVSIDDSSTAVSFLARHPEIATGHILVTCDNKLLGQYFKHTTIPHNIWIDRHGVILLISEGDAVTEKNVRTYLK